MDKTTEQLIEKYSGFDTNSLFEEIGLNLEDKTIYREGSAGCLIAENDDLNKESNLSQQAKEATRKIREICPKEVSMEMERKVSADESWEAARKIKEEAQKIGYEEKPAASKIEKATEIDNVELGKNWFSKRMHEIGALICRPDKQEEAFGKDMASFIVMSLTTLYPDVTMKILVPAALIIIKFGYHKFCKVYGEYS